MSQPPTQQAFSDRLWTILIHLYLNKWQCLFSVARERCDEWRIVPWENWDWLYEDSKGTDQPTHLHKMVCSFIVGIHGNISNWIWKYLSWSDQFAPYTGWKLDMTFYHGVAKNQSYYTPASGNRRVSVVIFTKVRWYFLYQYNVLILLKIKFIKKLTSFYTYLIFWML